MREDRPVTDIMVRPINTDDMLAELLPKVQAIQKDTISIRFGREWGLVEDKKGNLFCLCTEGVGDTITDDNPMHFDIYATSSPNTISLMPTAAIRLTLAEVLELPTRQPVELSVWVRTFGSRLDNNYRIWARQLSE